MIFIKKYFIIIALFFAPTFIFSQNISLMQYKGELGVGVGTAAFVGQVGSGAPTFKSNFNF
jgi:hypothetical protein